MIAPSPKKKRLLTEHQKEVRKAKKLERYIINLFDNKNIDLLVINIVALHLPRTYNTYANKNHT